MMMRGSAWVRVLVAALLFGCVAAEGAYLESDPTARDSEAPLHPPDVVRPAPIGQTAAFFSSLSVGAPWTSGGLTVFPLLRRGHSGLPPVATLAEAFSSGRVEVRERETSIVSEVLVRNNSGLSVLMLAGESLVGGTKNRILRCDVLLPPGSGFTAVPVVCGERGRWSGEGSGFGAAGEMAHPYLRRHAATGASQDAVWAEIDAQSGRAGVESPTRDYQRVYGDPEVRRRIDSCVAGFPPRWPPGAVGLIAAEGGEILGCDAFGDEDLFARLRDRVLRAYALNAVCRRDAMRWRQVTVGQAERYLRAASAARGYEESAPGEGAHLRLTGSVDGTALVWRGSVLHLALFGRGLPPPPPDPPIVRPFTM